MKNPEVQSPIGIADMPSMSDRQIYNSALAFPLDPQAVNPGYAARQNIKRSSRRKAKTSNIVGILFGIALIALGYTHNVITVNTLSREVNDLNAHYTTIISVNEVLKAEIARKASLDRIGLIAQERLGMTNPKEQPVWFEIDHEKLQEVLEQLESQ